MMAAIPERRRFPRVVRGLFLHYLRVGSDPPTWNVARVKDISVVGVSFTGDDSLEVHSQLELKLSLPTMELSPFRGTVVWRREVGPRLFEYGVVFRPLEPGAAAALRQFVDGLLRRHRQ